MALEVPVSCIEQVKTTELEPGAPVVRGRCEVAAQKVDGHLALATPLERSRPRRHIGIDRRLGREATRSDCGRQAQQRCCPKQQVERWAGGEPGTHEVCLTHV